MPSRKQKKVETKTYEIQILKPYECDKGEADNKIPEYGLEDNHVLMKQVMVDLKTNMKEEKIRGKILNSCKQQLPNLTSRMI